MDSHWSSPYISVVPKSDVTGRMQTMSGTDAMRDPFGVDGNELTGAVRRAGVSCCQMRIVDRLPSFPAVKPRLRGLQVEAYELLKLATQDRPVLKVDLTGEAVATAKRAFTVA